MNPEIVRELEKPLDSRHVASREQSGRKLSYVEGWHVIAEANRIFGFDGWNRETIELREVRSPELVKSSAGKETWRVGFIAKVRVTVGAAVREGTGYGAGALPDLGEAFESAIKEAETDAMKRALMTFGNPFGLALYDKTQANVSSGPSPVLEALLTNMPATSTADAKSWKDKQKAEIDRLSDSEFNAFKTAWTANLKTLTNAEKEAA